MQSKEKKSALIYGGMVFAGFLVIGASILIGRSDAGVIDINATILNSNTHAREAAEKNGEAVVEVPVNKFLGQANGGLVASGKPEELPPQPEVESASSTATSTGDGMNEENIDENGVKTIESTESDDNGETVTEPITESEGETPSS